MTRQRDPKTGRFIKAVSEPEPVVLPVFVRWPWQRCKTSACKLNKDHQGAHARPGGFGVSTW